MISASLSTGMMSAVRTPGMVTDLGRRSRNPTARNACGRLPSAVLFFFEAGFFVLAITAIVIGEAAGRELALGLWAGVTALSLAWRPVFLRRLESEPPADRREAQWRRAVSDSWRHLNKLLVIGLAPLAAWWWLARL